MMLGESNQKSYNIALKNVVRTMIEIVIEITNDSEWLSLLEKWRHARTIAQTVRNPMRDHVTEINQWKYIKKWYIWVYLLSLTEQWAYQAFQVDQ